MNESTDAKQNSLNVSFNDINSQIDRASTILEELKQSANNDLLQQEISDKTKNLTQEVLVKMRSVFDQTMNSFYDNFIEPNLEVNEKRPNVYFPIINNSNDLKSLLGRYQMKDLADTYPEIFNFIDSVQPYNSQYEWMKFFVEYSNDKHIRLPPQKRKEDKILTLEHGGASMSLGNGCSISLPPGSSISMGDKTIYGDQRIEPDSNFIRAESGINIKKEKWIAFTLADSNVNSLGLCENVVHEGYNIINRFFQLIRK